MVIRHFLALFFVVFLATSLFLAAFSAKSVKIPQSGVLNGALTQNYEDEFDKGLFHRAGAINFLNNLNNILFKEGREGVLIGNNGWLFTEEEFSLPDAYKANIEANENYILSVKDMLFQNNIKLFIIPVPAKARLFQNELGRYKYPQQWNSNYSNFLSFLGEKDIPHNIDLEIILSKGEAFLKTDTHWKPEGARSVAFNTAFHLEKIFPYLSWEQEEFISQSDGVVEHEGDLTRYTSQNKELINQWMTHRKNIEDDIFGSKNYPVVLVGTSYSANTLWNFEGFLKEALGADILNMSDEGLGPFEVMKNYLNSDTYKTYQPKLVIWEIPERYLVMSGQKENL